MKFVPMSQPSTTYKQLYPPTSGGYPQFIVPFGESSGRRAAIRLFLGSKESRHINADVYPFKDALEHWEKIQNYPVPDSIKENPTLRPSSVDLDPQVTDLPREGASFALPLLLLLSSLGATEFVFQDHPDPSTQQCQTFVGSIWASALMEDPITAHQQMILTAQFERFVDYCIIDVSSKRHIFFAPSSQRDFLQQRVQELHQELPIKLHDFDDTLAALRPIFLAPDKQDGHHVLLYEPNASSLNVLLEVFSSCWMEALDLAQTAQSTPSPASVSQDLQPGTVLGERYEITSRIGSGGFAVVYDARDTKVPRRVAIKVIELDRNLDARSRQSYIKRFEREARLAVSVHHPCVVEVFDLGVTDENIPYIVMELLEGWDLDSQVSQRGAMHAKRLIPLFIQALEGLGCAHEMNIVHKDLKPSNIFLKNPGKRHEQLCILDFGVARRINTATARLTHTDSAFGTPHYMAPEYSTSQIATPALDVYQMGLILVELLVGEPVVSHPEPVAAMFQHVRGDLYIPEVLLESSFGPVIRKALETNHLYRYQDGFEFADALRQIEVIDELHGLDKDAKKVSLNPHSAPDPLRSQRETPVMGAHRVGTDQYKSAPGRPLPMADLPPTSETDRVPEISPFASTLPFDDLPEQLSHLEQISSPELHHTTPQNPSALEELYPPPASARTRAITQSGAEKSIGVSDLQDGSGEDENVEIVDYSSKKPYIVLISVLILALVITSIALFRNKQQLNTIGAENPVETPEVVTEYDRQLAALRARAAKLEPMLSEGLIEEVISEVDEMDRSEARLTPEEVLQVQEIVDRARKERVNRTILDHALELVNDRQHERALDKLDTMSSQSVFWSHPDTRQVLDRAKVAILPQIQKLRDAGYPKRARALVEKLILHDPQNTELTYLLMDIINDIAAQPPALLPLKPHGDMGMMEGEATQDMDSTPDMPEDQPDQSR